MTISSAPPPLGSGADELRESFAELFHGAPCGYLTTTADGVITRANRTLTTWTGTKWTIH